MSELRLGVVGMSEGNGHPYSWSAIFNGFDPESMSTCPFPVIPSYLSQQSFPDAAIDGARVTHVWTQDKELSRHIAAASLIEHVDVLMTDMIGEVDAILLARDDAEFHLEMATPFLLAGLPVFIDKPLAFDTNTARALFELEVYDGQIFSCSSMRFAREFSPASESVLSLGRIQHVVGTVAKKWKTYSVHMIEPALGLIPTRGALLDVHRTERKGIVMASVRWEHASAVFQTFGDLQAPLGLTVFGEKGSRILEFRDTFSAFRASLQAFIESVTKRERAIPVEETMEIISIIE